MSITRYEDEVYGPSSYDFEKNESGSWVKYEDHAAEVARLNEQVQALAAEVQSVREQSEEVYAAGYNHGHLNTVDGIAYAPGTEGDFYSNALQVMAEADTPATDTAIREIGAKAIEGFADDWQGEDSHSAISEMARGYANKLRAGEVGSEH